MGCEASRVVMPVVETVDDSAISRKTVREGYNGDGLLNSKKPRYSQVNSSATSVDVDAASRASAASADTPKARVTVRNLVTPEVTRAAPPATVPAATFTGSRRLTPSPNTAFYGKAAPQGTTCAFTSRRATFSTQDEDN